MQALIDRYDLTPHPEGGFYKRIHQSDQTVFSGIAGAQRHALTHIYYLLIRGQVSRFHKVLHDEVWNHYEGAPLRLIRFDGRHVAEDLLGGNGGVHVAVIPGGVYQAAESLGAYTLVGCTVAPGFDFADFAFLRDTPADADVLSGSHAEYRRFL